MLIGVLVISTALGVAVRDYRQREKMWQVTAQLCARGAEIDIDRRSPEWLQRCFPCTATPLTEMYRHGWSVKYPVCIYDDVREISLTEEDQLTVVALHLANIRTLSLFRDIDSTMSRKVATFTRLETLCLGGCNVENWDEVVSSLEHACPNLASLELFRSNLSDADVQHIARLNGLRALNLSGTSITNQALLSLQSLPHLRELNLANTSVDDNCIDVLLRFPSLQEINLGAQVSPEGLSRLDKEWKRRGRQAIVP
jgi:hypothetical protein